MKRITSLGFVAILALTPLVKGCPTTPHGSDPNGTGVTGSIGCIKGLNC